MNTRMIDMNNRLLQYLSGSDVADEDNPSSAIGVERVRRWTHALGECVGNHPRASILAALALGAVVGWWLKRR